MVAVLNSFGRFEIFELLVVGELCVVVVVVDCGLLLALDIFHYYVPVLVQAIVGLFFRTVYLVGRVDVAEMATVSVVEFD